MRVGVRSKKINKIFTVLVLMGGKLAIFRFGKVQSDQLRFAVCGWRKQVARFQFLGESQRL